MENFLNVLFNLKNELAQFMPQKTPETPKNKFPEGTIIYENPLFKFQLEISGSLILPPPRPISGPVIYSIDLNQMQIFNQKLAVSQPTFLSVINKEEKKNFKISIRLIYQIFGLQ
jgi:hypothetical protein